MSTELLVFLIVGCGMISLICLLISATQSVNDELKEGKENDNK